MGTPIASNGTLSTDVRYLHQGDLARPGPRPVIARRISVRHLGKTLNLALYAPVVATSNAPAVVFLPGRMAPDDQYESYGRALASRGFVVAIHGWYSWFKSDVDLADDARAMADWLITTQGVDPARIGITGHSMGGKDAVLAAAQSDAFAGVVAIDPDDNGRVSVVNGALGTLRAPLLLIGAEVGWQAASVCAPQASNYQRFFEKAPPGTLELTLRDADHVQMLDEPDRFGYGICRCGTADPRVVRNQTRRALVGFFLQHLQGVASVADLATKGTPLRIAQAVQATEK